MIRLKTCPKLTEIPVALPGGGPSDYVEFDAVTWELFIQFRRTLWGLDYANKVLLRGLPQVESI